MIQGFEIPPPLRTNLAMRLHDTLHARSIKQLLVWGRDFWALVTLTCALAFMTTAFADQQGSGGGRAAEQLQDILLIRNDVEPIGLAKAIVELSEQRFGADSRETALALSNLAGLYKARRFYQLAEPLYVRSVLIQEKVFGRDHPEIADTLTALAQIFIAKGESEKAEPLLDHAAKIRLLRDLRPQIHDIGDKIRKIFDQGLDSDEQTIASLGSESQRMMLLQRAAPVGNIDILISLDLYSGNASPSGGLPPISAFTTGLAPLAILQRQGRILDISAGELNSVGKRLSAEDGVLLDKLRHVRSRFAAAVLLGAGRYSPTEYRAELLQLWQSDDRLQTEINVKTSASRVQTPAISVEAVQAALSSESAFIQFVVFRPARSADYRPNLSDWLNVTSKIPPRYAALVLLSTGKPQLLDLGDASVIDALCRQFRYALASPDNELQAAEIARQLDDLLMRPIRHLFGKREEILLATDGQLSLIPFAAFRDEQKKYLVERYQFTYLTGARDLLRLGRKEPSRQPPIILANLDYGSAQLAVGAGQVSNVSSDRRAPFTPLPGTANEARKLIDLLPNAQLLQGTEARKTRVMAVHGPQILHLATHGFFLGGTANGVSSISTGFTIGSADVSEMVVTRIALARSGVALAGVNGVDGWRIEGLLTALEVMNLDLTGTQLVVLSACDTGLGEVVTAEGVVGLRRAFMVAGARAQVMSLWRVSDAAAPDLIADFYRLVLKGVGRAAALQAVQKKMLQDGRSPFYWAPLILSGDPGPLGR